MSDGTTSFTGGIIMRGNGNYTPAVWVASTSGPLLTLYDNNASGVYGTTVFPRHVPSGAYGSSGEGQYDVIAPDHLTEITGSNVGTFTNGTTLEGSSATLNVDLLASGFGIYPTGGGFSPGCIQYPTGDSSSPKAPGASYLTPATSFCIGWPSAMGGTQLGGLVRAGELANGIPHALSIGVTDIQLNAHNTCSGNPHVWPATTQDGNDSGYGTGGSYSSNMVIGTLLAIPSSVNLNTLGIQTVQGMNVAKALQQYGGYIIFTGATGGTHYNGMIIWSDAYAASEITAGGQSFYNDLNNIVAKQVQVVTNTYNPTNCTGAPRTGFKIDGGDGTLLAPLAPPFGSQFNLNYPSWNGGNGRYP